MKIKFEHSPGEVSRMNTEELRDAFLAPDLVADGQISSLYSHYDRIILIGVKPLGEAIALENDPELRAAYFLERREIDSIFSTLGRSVRKIRGSVLTGATQPADPTAA